MLIIFQNQDNETLFIVLVAITILLLLLVVVVVLFSVFMKRKNTLLLEKEQAKKRFEKEIAETQIEIREETLRNISWELHDNIGQLLTLAKIQTQNCGGEQKDLDEAAATIGKGLTEIRTLSKLINPEALKNMSLPEALDLELERFNRMAYLKSSLEISGTPITIDKKIQVIIFRILQELFTNTIKHSKATNLDVLLVYKNDTLHVTVKDDGVGYNCKTAKVKNGIGLTNIETRAQLIGADIDFGSQLGSGTVTTMTYKPKAI